MTKLIYNSVSTMNIDKKKVIRKGKWQFVTSFADMDGDIPRTFGWTSYIVDNPTEGDLVKQAQRHLNAIGDAHHIYLEGIDVDAGKRQIRINLGS